MQVVWVTGRASTTRRMAGVLEFFRDVSDEWESFRFEARRTSATWETGFWSSVLYEVAGSGAG